MKAINNIKYFVSAVIVAMTLGACTQEYAEYVKADVPEGAQVFFANVPASIDLTDGDGTFEITAMRNTDAAEVTVGLASEADELFTVPANVTFAAGKKEAAITITYDPEAIVVDKHYNFTIALEDNTTPYGASSCSFSAGIITPELWTDFAMATFTEGFWGEEHKHMIKYREEGNVRYCIVSADEKCGWKYSDGTTCAGGVWGTGVDFEFVWYTDKLDANGNQILEVPAQYMGWEYEAGVPVYLYDNYHFYKDNMKNEIVSAQTFLEFAEKNGANYPLGYYDGNGGFFFNLLYMVPAMGAGAGFNSPEYDVVAICEGFERKVNYNADIEYSALYEGGAVSMMFSEDGTTPLEFPASVRYNEEVDDSLAVEYYLPNYFKEGYGLAFKAPAKEKLKDGDKIADVDNEQSTGLVMFGNEIYVNVKGGNVTFPDGGEFPVFTFKVAVYTMDEEGEKVFDFGQFEEVVTTTAYGKDFYTYDNLAGLYKESYLGNYVATYTDSYDGGSYQAGVTITDAGQDANGNELVAITGLSSYYGFGGSFDDTIHAMWNPNNGYLFITEPSCATPFPYQGVNFNVTAYAVDPETEDMVDGLPVLMGYSGEDDVLAIVGYPEYESYRGLYFADFVNGLRVGILYDYVLSFVESGTTSVKSSAPAKRAPMISANKSVEKASRTINSSNAVPYTRPVKDLSSMTIVKHDNI